jgi:hypothetical protein
VTSPAGVRQVLTLAEVEMEVTTHSHAVAHDKVVTINEAAVISGVSASTLKRQAKAEKLRILRLSPRRIGIRLSDLRCWLDNCAA